MPEIVADLSKYDPDEAAGQYGAVILNVEDPRMATKADIAHAAGRVIQLYSWVYAGDNGHAVTRAEAAAELLATDGITVVFIWLDYEEAGVSPGDLSSNLAKTSPQRTGVYTYAYLVGSIAHLLGGWYPWLAYYPGNNDGTYPEGEQWLALQWGAVLWQFTSSNGNRDLSAVLDPAAWALICRGTAPAPTPPEEDPDMQTMIFNTRKSDGKTFCYWRHGGELLVRGFTSGTPDAAVTVVSKDCDPTNLHIEDVGYGVLLTPSANGRLVQVTPSDFGPVAKVV